MYINLILFRVPRCAVTSLEVIVVCPYCHMLLKPRGYFDVFLVWCCMKVREWYYAMKAYVGLDVYIHIFLTSALGRGEWSASRTGRFTPGERAPGTHWIGGRVDPSAGPDEVDKSKFLILPGRTPNPRTSSPYPVTIPTALWNEHGVQCNYGINCFNATEIYHYRRRYMASRRTAMCGNIAGVMTDGAPSMAERSPSYHRRREQYKGWRSDSHCLINHKHLLAELHNITTALTVVSRLGVLKCDMLTVNTLHCLLEKAVHWFRRLVAGFIPRRPGFEPRSGHVGFGVDKVVLG
jgi:hypothetical protein